MADHFTPCLATDEATVRAILTAPPFSHTYVETLGPYTDGNIVLNLYTRGASVGAVGVCADAGNKVLIHSQAP